MEKGSGKEILNSNSREWSPPLEKKNKHLVQGGMKFLGIFPNFLSLDRNVQMGGERPECSVLSIAAADGG